MELGVGRRRKCRAKKKWRFSRDIAFSSLSLCLSCLPFLDGHLLYSCRVSLLKSLPEESQPLSRRELFGDQMSAPLHLSRGNAVIHAERQAKRKDLKKRQHWCFFSSDQSTSLLFIGSAPPSFRS